jgi:hypothetical protein
VAIQSWKWLVMQLILAAGAAHAEQPNVEELPPPVAKSVPKETLKGTSGGQRSADTPVGESTDRSAGSIVSGILRLSIIGEGRRYIVALTEEDPPAHPRIDPPSSISAKPWRASLGDRPADADRWNIQPVLPGKRRAGGLETVSAIANDRGGSRSPGLGGANRDRRTWLRALKGSNRKIPGLVLTQPGQSR